MFNERSNLVSLEILSYAKASKGRGERSKERKGAFRSDGEYINEALSSFSFLPFGFFLS